MLRVCGSTTVLTTALLSLCINAFALGQTEAISETSERHAILQHWIDGQEQLKSVEFRVTAKETRLTDQSGSKVFITTEQHSHISPLCCRHDVRQQRQRPNQTARGGVWLEFEDRIVSWNKYQNPRAVVNVGPLGDGTPSKFLNFRAYDPRLVPFSGTRIRTASLTFADRVRHLTRSMHLHGEPARTTQSTSVEFVPGLASRLYSQIYTKRRITFDRTKNFSPTSVTFHQLSATDDPTEKAGFLKERIDSEFIQVGELWLPETVIINRYSPLYNGGYSSRVELRFQYVSVNQEIDRGVFDVNRFGVVEGRTILDYRTNPDGRAISKVGACRPNGDPE